MTDVIKLALERFKRASEASAHNRKEALDDIEFTMGKQWPESIKSSREIEDRPCITINRVQQMVKQVTNDMRQNRAGLKVHPTGGEARQETAELRSGLIRQIESSSNAADHYMEAANCAVIGGEGYFRILAEYEDDGFEQCIYIKRVPNPLAVYYDPDCKEPDGSDAKYCFILEDLPKEMFTEQYPKADIAPWESEDEILMSWISEDSVRVAEYFSVEDDTADTIYLLTDGTQVRKSELPEQKAPPAALIAKERTLASKKCVWRKITAKEVLEETSYPIPYVMVIPVWGEEYNVGGKIYRMGIVRHAKDPQRVYNYARTAATEQVALAPRAPWVIAEGQVEGYEDIWDKANTKNYAYLPYKPQTVGGQFVSPPTRTVFAGVPAGSMADLNLASDEIKAVTGIYDAALGARSNETSGKAIMARQREADNATYHYVDNLNRAIRFGGRVINALLPVIYDTQRTIRILGEDGAESITEINAMLPDGSTMNNILEGKYDVVIQTGPSYETKRIEAVNSMTEFMQAVPNAAPMVADLIAKNMDWPGAEQIAERLKMLLPKEILQAEEDEGGLPPEVQAQIEEMQGVIQELQAAVAESQQKLASEDRKLDIEAFKAETDRLQALGEAALNEQQIKTLVADTLLGLLQPVSTPQIEAQFAGLPAQPTGEPGFEGVIQ